MSKLNPASLNTVQKRLCKVGQTIANLDADDQETMATWLANPNIRLTQIVTECGAAGIVFGKSVLGEHRRGTCICGSV